MSTPGPSDAPSAPASSPSDGAPAGSLTLEDLPPSPPPSKRRGLGTVRSMIISMVVLTAILLGFYAIVARPDRAERLPVDAVSAVHNARSIGKAQFSALEPTPQGWTANNALYEPGSDGVPTWAVGYVHDGAYAGLRQASKATPGWFSGQLSGFEQDGTRSLDGATWEQWKNAGSGEYRLVRRDKAGLSTIAVSSVSYDDAAAFVGRVTPKP